jgi:DNA-binding MarR family transcriptional regulator
MAVADGRPERLPIGQLLVNLLRLFRVELSARGEGLPDGAGLRPAHLQVFGSIKARGTRLTELASATNLSLSAMAELVDDLQQLGYVERKPDPSDGRAKLVCLTQQGWRAMRQGRTIIQAIERDWAARLGDNRFETLCLQLEDLLDKLDPTIRETYAKPPEGQP